MEVGSVLYILAALREAKFLGIHMFIENLVSFSKSNRESVSFFIPISRLIKILS